jgi:hypothetical protein
MQTEITGQTGPNEGRLIDMANGYVVEVIAPQDGDWKLKFFDRRLSPVAAPDLETPKITMVKAEAIGADRIVRSLALAAGEDGSTLVATGKTKAAEYARVHMSRADTWSSRYVPLNGLLSGALPRGPNGGHVVDMGHHVFIELLAQGDRRWALQFRGDDMQPTPAPDAMLIGAEALGADGSITELIIEPGEDPSQLIAIGRTQGAVRARIVWAHPEKHNPHWHRREFPL